MGKSTPMPTHHAVEEVELQVMLTSALFEDVWSASI
jgi:hypothetical protein